VIFSHRPLLSIALPQVPVLLTVAVFCSFSLFLVLPLVLAMLEQLNLLRREAFSSARLILLPFGGASRVMLEAVWICRPFL